VKITLVATPPAELSVDALAVAVATGQRLSGAALELDKALGGVLSEMITSADLRVDAGTVARYWRWEPGIETYGMETT